MSFLEKKAKALAEFVYKNFEANGSGHMILLTTMTGIALSALAQTAAIIVNNKYSTSQKAFMVPQELTEGFITILSILFVTTPLQILSKKAVKTGKIYSKEMGKYIKKYNLFNKGTPEETFNFTDCVNDIIGKVKKSDEFIKSSADRKASLLQEHNDILHNFDTFSDATSAIATTCGSIVSTALISPFIRNYTASHYQKLNMNIYDRLPQKAKQNISSEPVFKSSSYYYFNPCRY